MKRALVVVALAGCLKWDDARAKYCAAHPELCVDGGTAGGSTAGGGVSSAGGSAAGGGAAGGAAGGVQNFDFPDEAACGPVFQADAGTILWAKSLAGPNTTYNDARLAVSGCSVYLAQRWDSLVAVTRFPLDGGVAQGQWGGSISGDGDGGVVANNLAFSVRGGLVALAVPPIDGGTDGVAVLLDARDGGLQQLSSLSLPGLYPQTATLLRSGTELFVRFAGGARLRNLAAVEVSAAGTLLDAGAEACLGGTLSRASALPGEVELISGRPGADPCTIQGASIGADGFIVARAPFVAGFQRETFTNGVQLASSYRDGWVWSGWRATAAFAAPVLHRYALSSFSFTMPTMYSSFANGGFILRDVAAGPDGGSVYFVGDLLGPATYNGFALPWTSGADPVVVKLSASGDVVWATNIGDPAAADFPTRVVLIDDQLLVSGRCSALGTADSRCPTSSSLWLVSLAP